MALPIEQRIANFPQVKSLGDKDSKVWVVGRNPVHKEMKSGYAFQSGIASVFASACRDAGLSLKTTYRTNLINRIPTFDNFKLFVVKKAGLKGFDLSPREIEILRCGKADYFHPCLLPELNEFARDIRLHRPNLIIALGGEVHNWLTDKFGIEANRGFINPCRQARGIKVISTYAPGMFVANWALRPIVVADLIKAVREAGFPEIREVNRKVYIPETVEDVAWFMDKLTADSVVNIDIETYPSLRLIRSFGFSFDPSEGMTIPIVDLAQPDGSYWNPRDEVLVWKLIKTLCERPNEKIGQNFAYDIDWLYRIMGIKMINYRWDTMIMHHAMYPEMKKSLGFLASLYTDEPGWKDMVSHDPHAKKDG